MAAPALRELQSAFWRAIAAERDADHDADIVRVIRPTPALSPGDRVGIYAGMYLSRILATLRGHSRTPVPQNVLYSVRDWGAHAGLMMLDERGVLRCDDETTLRRFQQDAGAKNYIREVLDEKRVQLKMRYTTRRTQALLRDLGYLVETEV